MILEIDLGNSRLKWREVAQDGTQGPVGWLNTSVLNCGLEIPLTVLPRRIRVASVRGPADEAALTAWANASFGINPEFARSTATKAGVLNGYDIPEALGVDRWLAVLSAFTAQRAPIVVMDFGTAMTADAISGDGRFLGGFIAPGLSTMKTSLLRGTDRVRFAESQISESLSPATDTQCAVSRGIMLAATGFATSCWTQSQAVTGASKAILTGGDAAAIAPYLTFPFEIRPDLVLDGLAIALP